jgi:hypothetical protein
MSYPLFVPPDEFALKTSRSWTPAEAHGYLDWLLSVIQERTDFVLDYFSRPASGAPAEILSAVGERLVVALPDPLFTEREGGAFRGLTDRGYALAADLGLLVARLILGQYGDYVVWQVGDGQKDLIYYNRPVLSGVMKIPVDPIGASISMALSTQKGRRGSEAWLELYRAIENNIV